MRRLGLIKLLCSLIILIALSAAVIVSVVLGKAILADARSGDGTESSLSSFEKGSLVILSSSASATYNGTPLMSNSWELLSGELKAGHKIFVTVSGSQMGAGSSENHFNVVIRDEKDKDVTSQYNIDKIPGTLTVKPRSLTIKAGDASKCYDNTPLTTDKYILKTPLLDGDIMGEVIVSGSITEVGNTKSYIEQVAIFNRFGDEVTKNYNIKTEEGYLVVYPPNTIIIVTAGDEKEYDGNELYRHEWELLEPVEFIEGHKLVVKVIGTITEPGTVLNEFRAKVIDESTGEDVSSNYHIARDENNLGKLTVEKRKVTITSESDKKKYDKSPLVNPGYTIDPQWIEVSDDITYEIRITGTQTEVGSSPNTIEDDFKFFYKGEDVTDFFDVTQDEGILEVTQEDIEKEKLEFKVKDKSKVYDATPLWAEESDCVLVSGTLKKGHTVKAVVSGSRTEFGTSQSKIESIVILDGENDVSKMYEITKKPGNITIDKLAIKISSGSAEKDFDGSALSCDEIDYEILSENVDESVFDNFSFICEAVGIITDPGTAPNTISYSMKDKSGKDIDSRNFDVKLSEGTLEIFAPDDEENEDKKPILTYKTNSVSKTYDGTALDGDDYAGKRISGELLEGHTEQIVCISSITEVGTIDAELQIRIMDGDIDVSSEYEIKHEGKNVGKLTVKKRAIALSANDKKKEYDGTPLLADGYTLEGTLAPGQKLEVVLSGSQTDANDMPGADASYSVIESFRIIDVLTDTEIDVNNYSIPTPSKGKLVVTGREIDVKVTDASKPYDGLPLESNEYTFSKTGDSSKNALVDGHYLEVTIEGSRTDPGTSLNEVTEYHVYVGAGENKTEVTSNYKVNIKNGILTVIGADDQDCTHTDANEDGECDNCGADIGGNTPGGEGGDEDGDGLGEGDIGIGGGTSSTKVLFKVKTQKADTIYLKSTSYGKYVKNGWKAAPVYSGPTINSVYSESAFFATGHGLVNSTGSNYVLSCSIDSLAGMYVLPYYVWGEVASSSDDTKSIGSVSALREEFTYVNWDFTASSASLVFPQSASSAMDAYTAYVTAEDSPYLEIDSDSYTFFDGFAREKGINKESSTLIFDIANVIKTSARYNLNYNKELDSETNIATAFLSEKYKEGICQHYASADTLLYRYFGIPARYTTGFAVQTKGGVETPVLAKMAHAWVEVFVNGVGWVNIEVTGSGSPALGEDNISLLVTPSSASAKASATENGFDPDDKVTINGFEKLREAGFWYSAEVKAKGSADGKFYGLGYTQSEVTALRIYEKFEGTDYLVYEYVNGVETVTSDRFSVTYAFGSIHRYIADLNFSSREEYNVNKLKKTYDGKALDFTAVFTSGEFVEGNLVYSVSEDGDYRLIITPKVMIDCCTAESAGFEVKVMKAVVDEYGNKTYSEDVTDYYNIVRLYGSVTISKREIDVTAPSAQKNYDGNALTKNSYDDIIIAPDTPLADGDIITGASIVGSQTLIGESENKLLSVTIKNAAGKNVTDNYIINKHDGKLIVDP